MTGAVSLPGQNQREEQWRPAPAPHADCARVPGTHLAASTANERAMAWGESHQRRRTRKNTEPS